MAASKDKISQEKQELNFSSRSSATTIIPPLSMGTNKQTFLNDLAVRNELQATFKTYVEILISKSKIMPVPTIRGDIHFGVEKKTVEIDCAENTDAVNALVANHLASKGIKVTIIPATRFSNGFIAIPQKLEIHSSEKLLISVINTEIQLPAMIETLNRRATAGQCRPPLKMGLNPIC